MKRKKDDIHNAAFLNSFYNCVRAFRESYRLEEEAEMEVAVVVRVESVEMVGLEEEAEVMAGSGSRKPQGMAATKAINQVKGR